MSVQLEHGVHQDQPNAYHVIQDPILLLLVHLHALLVQPALTQQQQVPPHVHLAQLVSTRLAHRQVARLSRHVLSALLAMQGL